MRHTTSKRGAGGQFTASGAPTAKRVEVWLQPTTIGLLDSLCKQWGVGRGKVIDQLLTRGPVPPAAWAEVEGQTSPPAAPAAPPPPAASGPDPIKFPTRNSTAKAEAKALGCTAKQVESFKTRHQLPQDEQMSAEAQQHLCYELEEERKTAKGQATASKQRLQRLQERATSERISVLYLAMRQCKPDDFGRIHQITRAARQYFSSALELVGLKPQVRITPKLVKTLQELVPAAAHLPLSTTFNNYEAILWGAVLRLSVLEDEPPTTSGLDFLDWCQYYTAREYAERIHREQFSLSDALAGRMSEEEARKLLDLPGGVELSPNRDVINSAYRAKVRFHHPDLGGDPRTFRRLTEARDRLLQKCHR